MIRQNNLFQNERTQKNNNLKVISSPKTHFDARYAKHDDVCQCDTLNVTDITMDANDKSQLLHQKRVLRHFSIRMSSCFEFTCVSMLFLSLCNVSSKMYFK